MNCEQAKELMALAWASNAPGDADAEFSAHLNSCPRCAEEMAQLTALWLRMGDLPVPEPSPAMRRRWERTLDEAMAPRRSFRWWPRDPVWQMGLAAACLLVGIFVGSRNQSEIGELRREVASTKQLVALSLLQQQSAAERLRGVDYTSSLRAMEPEVVGALLQAVSADPNVNVRLAAVDALSKVSADARVRRELVGSLPAQDSPLVQTALIEYAVGAHDSGAAAVLKDFGARQDLDPLVKQRVAQALRELAGKEQL